MQRQEHGWLHVQQAWGRHNTQKGRQQRMSRTLAPPLSLRRVCCVPTLRLLVAARVCLLLQRPPLRRRGAAASGGSGARSNGKRGRAEPAASAQRRERSGERSSSSTSDARRSACEESRRERGRGDEWGRRAKPAARSLLSAPLPPPPLLSPPHRLIAAHARQLETRTGDSAQPWICSSQLPRPPPLDSPLLSGRAAPAFAAAAASLSCVSPFPHVRHTHTHTKPHRTSCSVDICAGGEADNAPEGSAADLAACCCLCLLVSALTLLHASVDAIDSTRDLFCATGDTRGGVSCHPHESSWSPRLLPGGRGPAAAVITRASTLESSRRIRGGGGSSSVRLVVGVRSRWPLCSLSSGSHPYRALQTPKQPDATTGSIHSSIRLLAWRWLRRCRLSLACSQQRRSRSGAIAGRRSTSSQASEEGASSRVLKLRSRCSCLCLQICSAAFPTQGRSGLLRVSGTASRSDLADRCFGRREREPLQLAHVCSFCFACQVRSSNAVRAICCANPAIAAFCLVLVRSARSVACA